jgi:glycosyltransferase involved in cell wall biosynthesis
MKRVVVTPVYEDAVASARLFKELRAALGETLFIVAVDDGSVREPVDIANLTAAGADGVVIRLRRNVGHQRAIAIGLSYVAREIQDAEYVVVMDSDGEDLPATIAELVVPLQLTDVDVVVARRRSRVESLRFRAFYRFYKWLFHMLSGREISFGNFMALKPAAVRRLAAMQELWVHVAACVLASKLRVAICPLDRGPRYAGSSKMNFVGLALHGFRALMVFADDVLMRVGIASAFIAALAVLGGVVAILLKLNDYATPGWFSVALGVLSIVFLQTGALTLMSLMLTGVVRSGSVATVDYREFIDQVLRAPH